MSIDPKQVQLAFLEAVQVAGAERSAVLDRICAGDDELRRRVEMLLRAHDDSAELPSAAGEVLGTVTCKPGDDTAALRAEFQPGTVVVGRYKLIEQIGEGAMGAVFMAQQAAPVKRVVAVKIVKPGMDSKAVLARFEAERQALALMEHPNIARVLDAGSTESGRPFFVMELVKGIPITEYCDQRKLTVRQRLELFVPVCQAIQHAHQKGVVHRDIKPSNVLVAPYDDKPVPKVIDFGLAKATGQALTDKTLLTGFGAIVGTLQYMSPEQANLNNLDIDTRSDIYSLDVLMYELLTSSTPLDRKSLGETALLEVLRIVREVEAPRPSTKLSSSDALPSIAANRNIEPARLTRLMKGELDWVLLKALEKDRTRRYATANGLAHDIQRYLADEVVEARPPSSGYRLQKFLRKYKGQVIAGGLVLLALLGGVVGTSIGMVQAQKARSAEAIRATADNARRERNADAVKALLDQGEGALRAGDAAKAAVALEAAQKREVEGGADDLADRQERLNMDLTALIALNKVDQFRWTPVENKFPDAPAVTGRYREALARFGVAPESMAASEAAERVSGSAVRDRLLAALDHWLLTEKLVWVRAVLRVADPDSYRDAVRNAVLVQDIAKMADMAGRPEAAVQPPGFVAVLGEDTAIPIERRRELLAMAVRKKPGDLGLLMALGMTYPMNQKEGAEERLRWFQAAVGVAPENPAAHSNLGSALGDKGDLDGAIAEYKEAIQIDPKHARAHNNLGIALLKKGDPNGAIAECKEAIRIDRKYANAHNSLGNALRGKGDYDGAMAEFKEAIRIDPNCANAHNNLGLALGDRGDLDGAIAEHKEAIRIDPKRAGAHYTLGLALRDKGDPNGAIAEYKEAIRIDPKYVDAYNNLSGLLMDKGRLDEAIAYYREAIELGPKAAVVHYNLGIALQRKDQVDGAIAEYKEAIRMDPKFAGAHNNLGLALREKGDPYGAIAEYKEAIRIDPKFAKVHDNLGAVLCDQMHDYDRAIATFRRAIELNPNSANAHFNLGNALRGKGDPNGAIAEFKEAIRIDPKLAKAHDNLGAVLCDQMHDYDRAIASFRRAIELDPNSDNTHFSLAIALGNKGDSDGAIAEYKETIRINPKNTSAHNNLVLRHS